MVTFIVLMFFVFAVEEEKDEALEAQTQKNAPALQVDLPSPQPASTEGTIHC